VPTSTPVSRARLLSAARLPAPSIRDLRRYCSRYEPVCERGTLAVVGGALCLQQPSAGKSATARFAQGCLMAQNLAGSVPRMRPHPVSEAQKVVRPKKTVL
jgi:hypothetical protein